MARSQNDPYPTSQSHQGGHSGQAGHWLGAGTLLESRGSGRNAVGSANDLDFSVDRDQQYMFVDDVGNSSLWVYDRLLGNRIRGGFGRPGHAAGEFTLFHSAAVDSKGNIYTGETVGGRRSQKFVPRGFIATGHLPLFRGSPHYDPLPGKASEHTPD